MSENQTIQTCDNCGHPTGPVPPEPPVGTWVKDRRGGTSVRVVSSDGRDGWAPAPTGFYPAANWESMWKALGPLVECEPWGQ